MANQPPRPGASKDKDDDSWGKLASDLFGIQFGETDDDFDLPDEGSPVTNAPAEPKAAPTLADVVPVAEAAGPVSDDEPDVSFPVEDDASEPAPKRTVTASSEPPAEVEDFVQEEESATQPVVESEKDIWDLLETWNWDEAPRDAGRSRSTSESQPAESRSQSSRGSGQRGDRDSRRERSPERDRQRPGRSNAPESETSGEPPRESRPRREERPRRGDRPDRERTRSERPAESRPAEPRPARAEETERPRHRPAPAREIADSDEDFASGLDDSATRSQPPARESSRSGSRRQQPSSKPSAVPTDDFDADLFAELESSLVDESPEETDEVLEAEPKALTDEDRPRRRRRRRRGMRNRRDEVPQAADESDESMETPEAAESLDDDFAGAESEGGADEAERGLRRRRKRRRIRRRSEESVERVEVDAEAADTDEGPLTEDEAVDEESLEPELEEEPVVAVSYEGIPSWEEAISYLQRRPRESRGRGDGPPRGRGGPHRR